MSRGPRLSSEQRARILEELAAHDRFTLKAIALRHGVSVATLWRLRDEERDVNGFRSDSEPHPAVGLSPWNPPNT